jgi:hypothetical protein
MVDAACPGELPFTLPVFFAESSKKERLQFKNAWRRKGTSGDGNREASNRRITKSDLGNFSEKGKGRARGGSVPGSPANHSDGSLSDTDQEAPRAGYEEESLNTHLTSAIKVARSVAKANPLTALAKCPAPPLPSTTGPNPKRTHLMPDPFSPNSDLNSDVDLSIQGNVDDVIAGLRISTGGVQFDDSLKPTDDKCVTILAAFARVSGVSKHPTDPLALQTYLLRQTCRKIPPKALDTLIASTIMTNSQMMSRS